MGQGLKQIAAKGRTNTECPGAVGASAAVLRMLPALPWQVLPSPSKAIKHYNPVLTLAEMSFEVIIVRGGMMLSDSHVGMSSSLE